MARALCPSNRSVPWARATASSEPWSGAWHRVTICRQRSVTALRRVRLRCSRREPNSAAGRTSSALFARSRLSRRGCRSTRADELLKHDCFTLDSERIGIRASPSPGGQGQLHLLWSLHEHAYLPLKRGGRLSKRAGWGSRIVRTRRMIPTPTLPFSRGGSALPMPRLQMRLPSPGARRRRMLPAEIAQGPPSLPVRQARCMPRSSAKALNLCQLPRKRRKAGGMAAMARGLKMLRRNHGFLLQDRDRR